MVLKFSTYFLVICATMVTTALAQSIPPSAESADVDVVFVNMTSTRAAANLRAGAIITAEDLDIRGGAPEAIASYSASLVGLELKRNIYAGRAITKNDVKPPTLVKRNAIITVRYTKGPLLITTEGRALSAGAKGELIRIINLESKTTLTAIVAGPNLARAQ